MELREKANEIFVWGKSCRNDGLVPFWENHSRGAAKVAERVAEKCGLDKEKAYAGGLLHDIGRYRLNSGMNHIMLGYRKLTEENLPEMARICLTHTFNPKSKLVGLELEKEEDERFVRDFITKVEYDDYDKLIQLADYMSGSHGISTIERRFCSVLARHNLDNPHEDLVTLYELKGYFDEKCGVDIYTLFREEIAESAFRGIPGKEASKRLEEIKKAEKEEK